MTDRTGLPPLLQKLVYGPAAWEEVRRIMREAKRERINLGWSTKKSLCKVSNGERPLSYGVWEQTQAYVRRIQREREHERDVRERPIPISTRARAWSPLGWCRGMPTAL